MGLSVCAMTVTDDQIRSFEEDGRRADDLCHRLIPYSSERCCHLLDYWGGLHHLLTAGAGGRELPLCALGRGDVEFEPVSDPTWAIHSSTVAALATELAALSEAELRRRYAPRRMREPQEDGASVYPGRLWAFPEHEESIFQEIMEYFVRLRDFVTGAAGARRGLLFCRYEDW